MLGIWGFILLGLIGLVALVMVASFGGAGVAYLLRIRQVEGAAGVHVGDLARDHRGWLRVRGIARPVTGADSFPAPGSGRACLAWAGLVERRKDPDWVPVRYVSSSEPFVLQDNGAAVTVEPEGALWHLGSDELEVAGGGLDDEAVARIFGDLEPPTQRWRLLQRIVPDGSELTLVGPAPSEPGAPLRPVVLADEDPLPAVTVLRGRALAAVLVSAVLVAAVFAYMLITLRDAGLL
jgi:hypothetical protein